VDYHLLVEVALVLVVLVVAMLVPIPVRSLFTHLDSQAMLLAVLLDSLAILICMVVEPRWVAFVFLLYTFFVCEYFEQKMGMCFYASTHAVYGVTGIVFLCCLSALLNAFPDGVNW